MKLDTTKLMTKLPLCPDIQGLGVMLSHFSNTEEKAFLKHLGSLGSISNAVQTLFLFLLFIFPVDKHT